MWSVRKKEPLFANLTKDEEFVYSIEHYKNGYLIPYNPEYFREKYPFETEIMALRMVDLLSDTDRLAMFSKRSYEISERFLSNHIKKKWCDLIEEQTRTIERN